MKTNKRPVRSTIHPKAGFKVMNGYGHMTEPRPFTVQFNGTRWKKLTRSLLITTPQASHAIVDFDDGSFVKISI